MRASKGTNRKILRGLWALADQGANFFPASAYYLICQCGEYVGLVFNRLARHNNQFPSCQRWGRGKRRMATLAMASQQQLRIAEVKRSVQDFLNLA